MPADTLRQRVRHTAIPGGEHAVAADPVGHAARPTHCDPWGEHAVAADPAGTSRDRHTTDFTVSLLQFYVK